MLIPMSVIVLTILSVLFLLGILLIILSIWKEESDVAAWSLVVVVVIFIWCLAVAWKNHFYLEEKKVGWESSFVLPDKQEPVPIKIEQIGSSFIEEPNFGVK
tara:strand:+ start:428 stop:733 length:306 start_codon:yes stop_codon:yes gene_type:complete